VARVHSHQTRHHEKYNSSSGNIEALVSFVARVVAKEDTLFRMKLKFPGIVWPKMGPTCTTEYLEPRVIRFCSKELLKW
jgi:hypothetical protein